MVFHRFILILFLFGILTKSQAQETAQKIERAYQLFSKHPNLSGSTVGFAVMNSQTGEIVFENNMNTPLATASTLKTITSISAFDLLKKDYQYKTTVYYTGTVNSAGELLGDIIIQGSGDPTFGSDRFEETNASIILDKILSVIKEQGIKSIKGRIIGDDLFFDGNAIPNTWVKGDIGNYYGTGVSGLNWKENKFGIIFQTGQVDHIAPVKEITDNVSYLNIVNEVKTGNAGTGDNVSGYSSPYAKEILIRGTHGRDLKKIIEFSIPDPAYQFAVDLRDALHKGGIQTRDITLQTGKKLKDTQQNFGLSKKTLVEFVSPKLSDIIFWFNTKSINLYGEALLKTIGQQKNILTTEESTELIINYWKNQIGINTLELNIQDGSGLSPQNRVSPSSMLQIMNYAKNCDWFNDFFKSLPTINNMKMKSGTIAGVLGYTGYQKNSKNENLTFVLLVTNYKGNSSSMRQQMFRLLDVLK